MKSTRYLFAAVFTLPLLGLCLSCGGGEAADTAEESSSNAATGTESSTATDVQAPAITEAAAKTEQGKDALETLEENAGSAVSAAARTMFDTYCFTCHGTGGAGDGPAGAALDPHPANFTDSTWQASVTDDFIRKIIADGGLAIGKSALMPPAPGAKDNDELLEGLLAIVRGFGE